MNEATIDYAEKTPAELARVAQLEALTHLGPFVMNEFTQAATHRRATVNGVNIDEKLMSCLRDINGRYSSEEEQKINQLRQPVLFIQHADLKRRTCNAMLGQLFFEATDPPWALKRTPVPEVSDEDAMALARKVLDDWYDTVFIELVGQGATPEEAQELVAQIPPDPLAVAEYAKTRRDEIDNLRNEESEKKVDRMSVKIHDQTLEGSFSEAFKQCIDYASTYGTCVLKGPCRRLRKRVHFVNGECKLAPTEVLEWEAISPFDCYPAKGVTSIQKGNLCIRVRYTPKELRDMAKIGPENGYFPDAIKRVLDAFPNGDLRIIQPIDSEKSRLENDGSVGLVPTAILEGIEFWGDINGAMLIEKGIIKTTEGEPVEPDDYYDTHCIVFNNEVVFASLTDEKLGRYLYKGTFYRVPNSWWGDGPVEKMRDPARSFNASWRAKCVNVTQCSGPVQSINVAKMLPGQTYEQSPYKQYLYSDPTGQMRDPVNFKTVDANITELWGDLEATQKLFDTVTGIPSNTHSNDTAASAGRTYNGLLLIMTAAKQGANEIVFSLFQDVLKPALIYLYRYNMLFDEDPSIKGDCEVDAGGLLAIMVREQNRNYLESFLNMAVASPAVFNVIGDVGMGELLRTYIHLLQGINPDKIVPSEEEIEKRRAMKAIEDQVLAAAQAGAGAAPGQTPAARAAAPQAPRQTPMEAI